MSAEVCGECGRELARSARFCGVCGARAQSRFPGRRFRPWRWWYAGVAVGGVALTVLAAILLDGPGPVPEEPGEVAVGTPSGTPPSGGGSRPGTALAATEMLTCLVDGEPVEAAECVIWEMQSDGVYIDVETSGTVVVAATADDVTAWDLGTGTGQFLWRWEGPSDSAPSHLVVSDETVALVHEADDRIVLFDLVHGPEGGPWAVPIRDGRQAWVALDDETLVVREPTSMRVYQADRAPGGLLWRSVSEPVWEQRLDPVPGMTPLLTDNRVITVTATGLAAWDRSTGALAWERPELPARLPLIASEVDDVLVTRSADALMGIALTDGTVVWERTAADGDLVALPSGRFAVVSGSTARIREASTGRQLATLEPGHVDAAEPARPNELLLTIGSTVQRWDIDLAGPTWVLRGLPPRPSTERGAIIRTATWGRTLVAVLQGSVIVAVDLPAGPPERAQQHPSCPDAQPSNALGTLDAWRGSIAHVAVADGYPSQLWIGLPGYGSSTEFTVEAQLVGSQATARFYREADPTERLQVEGGARSSGGYPTHWVVGAEFPTAGCWEITITADDLVDTIILPLRAPTVDR